MNYSVLSRYRSELMGVAMLWVLLYHTWGLQINNLALRLLQGSGSAGVDIFLLMSGVGLVASLCGREQSWEGFMARRAGRVLPAYFITMVPYTVYLIWQGQASVSTLLWNATMLSTWVNPPGAINWYIPAIMTYYALTPWCFRRLRKSKHRELLTLAAVAAGVLATQIFLRDGFWAYGGILYHLPIFALGLLIGFYVREEKKITLPAVLFWAAALAAGMAYGAIGWVTPVPGLDTTFWPQPYAFLLWTVPLCLLLCLCFRYLPLGGLRAVLRWIGERSLEIYLLNATLFLALYPLLLPRFDFPWGGTVYYLIATLLNIALGGLLHWTLRRTGDLLARRRKARETAAP